jgi:hypothetical protein
LSPVQFLRNQQPVRRVVRAQREWIDATIGRRQAPLKIGFDTGGSLIAVLGVFGEELHSKRRQRLGIATPSTGRIGWHAIWQWNPSSGSVRQTAARS